MTKHEKKALRRVIKLWAETVKNGRSLSKECQERGWDTAKVATDVAIQITLGHARQSPTSCGGRDECKQGIRGVVQP